MRMTNHENFGGHHWKRKTDERPCDVLFFRGGRGTSQAKNSTLFPTSSPQRTGGGPPPLFRLLVEGAIEGGVVQVLRRIEVSQFPRSTRLYLGRRYVEVAFEQCHTVISRAERDLIESRGIHESSYHPPEGSEDQRRIAYVRPVHPFRIVILQYIQRVTYRR